MTQQRVLVTGGSRGIGRAIVEQLCREGARVAFTYHASREAACELAERTGAIALCADAADPHDICAAVDEAVHRLGGLDALVNNAGIGCVGLVDEIDDATLENLIGVNLTAPYRFCREALRYMLRAHAGRIVNVSSMWGIVGASCEVAYSMTKAGVIGLTKALAKEVGPSGITVNAVAPGVIDTDMNAALDGEDRAALCDATPLGRIGTPQEVACAVRFLLSEGAAFMTGAVLNVSGGFVV